MLFLKKLLRDSLTTLRRKSQLITFNLSWFFWKDRKIRNINNFELKVYSENGEDGILKIIFYKVGTTNKFFLEIGTGDGTECNTKLLLEEGWNGLQIDCKDYDSPFIKKEFVTTENVEKILRKYTVPEHFDLLSLDINGNDYWVWRALKNFRPRVVVIEYNSSVSPDENKVIAYNPKFKWDGTNYFGASLLALTKLADSKRYSLLGCETRGVNAFFLESDLVKDNFELKDVRKLYKPPRYGVKVNGRYIGHLPSKKFKTMIAV